VEICVDLHQRTTPAYAVELARQLAPMRPFFLEDPVPAENVAEFAYLRASAVPYTGAAGEQMGVGDSSSGPDQLLQGRPVHLRGLTESRKLPAGAKPTI